MFHIIVNPGSCSGRGLENWHKIEPRFQENGEAYKVYCSSIDKTIRELAAEITTNKMDAASKADASGTEDVIKLVVLGGDGSVNEAVNGIRDFQKTRLGFIPVGSGNDLSLSLGLPDDRDRIIDRILKGEVVRSVDVGELITHNRSCELDPVSHEPIPGLQEPHKSGEHWLFNISSDRTAAYRTQNQCAAVTDAESRRQSNGKRLAFFGSVEHDFFDFDSTAIGQHSFGKQLAGDRPLSVIGKMKSVDGALSLFRHQRKTEGVFGFRKIRKIKNHEFGISHDVLPV